MLRNFRRARLGAVVCGGLVQKGTTDAAGSTVNTKDLVRSPCALRKCCATWCCNDPRYININDLISIVPGTHLKMGRKADEGKKVSEPELAVGWQQKVSLNPQISLSEMPIPPPSVGA